MKLYPWNGLTQSRRVPEHSRFQSSLFRQPLSQNSFSFSSQVPRPGLSNPVLICSWLAGASETAVQLALCVADHSGSQQASRPCRWILQVSFFLNLGLSGGKKKHAHAFISCILASSWRISHECCLDEKDVLLLYLLPLSRHDFPHLQ